MIDAFVDNILLILLAIYMVYTVLTVWRKARETFGSAGGAEVHTDSSKEQPTGDSLFTGWSDVDDLDESLRHERRRPKSERESRGMVVSSK